MPSFVLEKVQMLVEKQEDVSFPVRAIITYKQNKQNSFLENLRQKEFLQKNSSLNIGFFEYFIEETPVYCKKRCYPGVVVFGYANSLQELSALSQHNSISCFILSGNNIYNPNRSLKKPILFGTLVVVEFESSEIFDFEDFRNFIKRAADVLAVGYFVISENRKSIIVDFFSENDISMLETKHIFKIFSVLRYVYIVLN